MSVVGSVNFFDLKKGWGFITVLTQGLEQSNTGVYYHRTAINAQEGSYKCLYPGEYVSFNIGDSDRGPICIDICGIMGGPLLTDHPKWRYKLFEKPKSRDRSNKIVEETSEEKVEETVEEKVEEDENDPEA
jgi:cold shock CspA family protein